MAKLENFFSGIKGLTDRLRSKPEVLSAEEFSALTLDKQADVLSIQMIRKLPRSRFDSFRFGGVHITPGGVGRTPPAYYRHSRVSSHGQVAEIVTVQDDNEKVGEQVLIFPADAFADFLKSENELIGLSELWKHTLFMAFPDVVRQGYGEMFEDYVLENGFTEDSAKECLLELYLRLTEDAQQRKQEEDKK